jgi:hypothetical protein
VAKYFHSSMQIQGLWLLKSLTSHWLICISISYPFIQNPTFHILTDIFVFMDRFGLSKNSPSLKVHISSHKSMLDESFKEKIILLTREIVHSLLSATVNRRLTFFNDSELSMTLLLKTLLCEFHLFRIWKRNVCILPPN